jgi:heme exporter protein B
MTLLRQAVAVAAKDLRVEIRGRRTFGAAAPFAATMLLSFGLALGPGRSLLQAAAPGLLWLAVLFASVVAFGQSYRAEADDDALEGFVLGRIDDAAVFLGKAAAVWIELLVLEVVVVVLAVALFDLPPGGSPLAIAAALVLGTVGLAAVGSLFGVVAESPRAGTGILPLLILPLATPVLLAGVQTTELSLLGSPGRAGPWLALLVAFDVAFLATGTLVFGHLLEER